MECKGKTVLMCGSALEVRGGMVSVIKNYLEYRNWEHYSFQYIPTHIEKNKVVVLIYFFQAYLRIIVKAIRKEFTIAYFHTAERGSFFRKAILVRTLRRFGIKTVMHHHAAEFESFYSALSPRMKKFAKGTLEMADLNIVLSNSLADLMKEKAPKANIRVLYNSVEVYKMNPYNMHAKNVLFLGRLGERKGTYDLLTVIKMLDKKLDPCVKFYLCGDGEVEKVQNKINEYQIAHRIAHIGWIDGEQKKEFMKDTMLNVLPSYNEGLPMTILETMAYGIPNISTRIASIPEVIQDGQNGFLILPGDIDALAELIGWLASDIDVRMRVSERAWRDISSCFALGTHVETLKDYLDKL